jgi:hypothetical protein
MKALFKAFLLLMVFGLTGCFGLMSSQNELVGQPKKIIHNTPILCPDHYSVDISLGVVRGGIGSVSNQDKWLYVPTLEMVDQLKQAIENGKLVKLTYDESRVRWCVDLSEVTRVEIVRDL